LIRQYRSAFGRSVGSEQELALRTAAGDQIELLRKDLSREHASARNKTRRRQTMSRFLRPATLDASIATGERAMILPLQHSAIALHIMAPASTATLHRFTGSGIGKLP
jgi:hypothetical protein